MKENDDETEAGMEGQRRGGKGRKGRKGKRKGKEKERKAKWKGEERRGGFQYSPLLHEFKHCKEKCREKVMGIQYGIL